MRIIRVGRPTLSVKLGTLNRWIRWTGFRVFVSYPVDTPEPFPMSLGIAWFGWNSPPVDVEKRVVRG